MSTRQIGRYWRIVLAITLIWWALFLFGLFDFDGADVILGVLALATAVMIFFDR